MHSPPSGPTKDSGPVTLVLPASWRDVPKDFSEVLTLPRVPFPPQIRYQTEDFACAGYFAAYEPGWDAQRVVKTCREGDWSTLSRLAADFLLFCRDGRHDRMLVVVDQAGSFPCFYTATNRGVVASTDLQTVLRRSSESHLDADATLRFIAREFRNSPDTLVAEVGQIPAGARLVVTGAGLCSIESWAGSAPPVTDPPLTQDELGDRLIEALAESLEARLDRLGSLPVATDLTSGMDSSLLAYLASSRTGSQPSCYAMVSESTADDCQASVVEAFSRRHGLETQFVSVEHSFPLADEDDLAWAGRTPGGVQGALLAHYFGRLREEGLTARVTGDGGDEVYLAPLLRAGGTLEFESATERVEMKLAHGLGLLLTPAGVDALHRVVAEGESSALPLALPLSAVMARRSLFPLAWDCGVWVLCPFLDPRVFAVARRLSADLARKEDVWGSRTDIFLAEQLSPKAGFKGDALRFLRERTDLAIDLLERSRFSASGWIRVAEIIDRLRQGHTEAYEETEAGLYLLNLLLVEVFADRSGLSAYRNGGR